MERPPQMLPRLHRLCSELHSIDSVEDIPKKAAVITAELADVPYSEVWFRDEGKDSARLVAVNDDSYLAEDVPRVLPLGHSIVGEIITTSTLRVCPDLLKVPSWGRKEWSARKGLNSFLGVPLCFDGHSMGSLVMLARNRTQLGPAQLLLLQILADQTAIAMLRKRAERALRESEEQTRIFFDTALDAVITMEQSGRITGWNAQAESTFGWPRQQVIGRSIYETIIPSPYREEYEPWMEHLMALGDSQTSNTRIDIMALRQDGSEIPVELTISPIHSNGTVLYTAFLRDISERKKVEETLSVVNSELYNTKQRLTNIVDISPDPIISTNIDGEVVLFSKSAESLLGYESDDIIGNDVTELYRGGEWATEMMQLMRQNNGKVSDYETMLKSKDGNLIPVSITASFLYDEDGSEAGTLGFQKDLREIKRMEEDLQSAHDELIRAQEAMETAQASVMAAEKMAALGRLTAGVSHEILNPLNIVTLRLHMMLKDPEIPHDVSRHLRVLDEQASRISKIAQDLLYFARQRPPERRPVNLNGVIKRTLGLIEHDLRAGGISVEMKLSSGLPAIEADEDQLQQVLLNLLTNARDALSKGGRLSLVTSEVRVNSSRYAELRVEDSGKGIPQDKLQKIFDPFFTTKAEGEGTGLGLAICQGIIKQHGGDIWAENTSNGGAVFVVRLALK